MTGHANWSKLRLELIEEKFGGMAAWIEYLKTHKEDILRPFGCDCDPELTEDGRWIHERPCMMLQPTEISDPSEDYDL